MLLTHKGAHPRSLNDPVVEWLLDSDPSIRWQVMRDLTDARTAIVAAPPDARVEEAVAIVRERRQPEGRWLLDMRHENTVHEELADPVGAPNRWITLRALRVLDWYARSRPKER
jgi:hypothetical protein